MNIFYTLALIGYSVTGLAMFRIKNPRILLHFTSPVTGLGLWLIIISINQDILTTMTLISLSIVCAPIATQRWMRRFVNK